LLSYSCAAIALVFPRIFFSTSKSKSSAVGELTFNAGHLSDL